MGSSNIPGAGEQFVGAGTGNLTNLINSLNQINQAISALNKTVSTVFPIGQAVSSSAGSSSGKYLTLLAPDGNTYKVALLDV